jgi:chromosome partitioning protein
LTQTVKAGFGINEPDKLIVTLATVMSRIVGETYFDPLAGVIRNSEGVDILPANSNLSALEISLAGIIAPSRCGSRETILRQYIEKVKPLYNYIILDTAPTLDLLTINVFACITAHEL